MCPKSRAIRLVANLPKRENQAPANHNVKLGLEQVLKNK
jgi:hypothetical protein